MVRFVRLLVLVRRFRNAFEVSSTRFVSSQRKRTARARRSKDLIVEGKRENWLGWLDSNQRMAVPKTAALPLGYTPRPWRRCIARSFQKRKPSLPHSFWPDEELSPAAHHAPKDTLNRCAFPRSSAAKKHRVLSVQESYHPVFVDSFKKMTGVPCKSLAGSEELC